MGKKKAKKGGSSNQKSNSNLESRVKKGGSGTDSKKKSKGNYDNSTAYRSESKGYSKEKTGYSSAGYNGNNGEQKGKKKQNKDKKRKRKKKQEKNLEAMVESEAENIESMASELQEKGFSREQAYTIANEYFAGQKREGDFDLHMDIGSWASQMWQYYKRGKLTIGRVFKTALQLAMGLTEGYELDRNPYKDIEEALKSGENIDLFVTGLWGIPRDIRFFEKHSGKKFVYLNTIDPNVVDHYARLVMHATGRLPDVVAFSDGGKTLKLYGDKYGFRHVNQVYAVGVLPVEYSPEKSGFDRFTHPKVTYVAESIPFITAIEKNYAGINKLNRYEFPGDHLSPFYEKAAAKKIGQIMDNGPIRPNFNRSNLITKQEINETLGTIDMAKYQTFDFRKAA